MHLLSPRLVSGILACVMSHHVGIAADPANPPNAPDATPVAPAGMVVRFELFVKDTRVAADFYRRVLGFECHPTEGQYIQARNGSVHIGICDQAMLSKTHHFSPEALQGRKGVGTEIVLEVDNFDAHYQRVEKSGYAIHEGVTRRPWGLRDFRLVDPDGYYLRITEKSPAAN